MRLHQLTITAFGPFPDTVEVDFDALASGGLFLLTGATGAGKTSVLDAVCFALYGQVPGERAGAKHLRSDHAPPDREPRVVLDLSIGDRRLRFSRTPAWTRPKRRGAGLTSAPAHVVVEERRGEEWFPLTNRLEDAGLLVGDLLGMNCNQFTQVAMLPQGRFQAFLRASSAERHDVLQKLFRTDRFERVERWLVDRRIVSRRAAEAGEHRVRTVLTRLEESGATTVPADWEDALDSAGDDGRIAAWTTSLGEAATRSLAIAEARLGEAATLEGAAREAVAAVRGRLGLVERARRAAEELRGYEETTELREAEHARLDAARRAAPLDPLLTRSQASAAATRQAERSWTERRRVLAETAPGLVVDEPTRAALVRARGTAAGRLAEAVAFALRQLQLDDLERRRQETAAAIAARGRALARAESELVALPAQVDAAEVRRERTTVAVSRLQDLVVRVTQLEKLAVAASRAIRVRRELETARVELRAATDLAQSLREAHLDIREARINGMAAELAGALAVGCGCPVCGSAEHPAPARATASAVGRDEEADARRHHDDAVIAELGHQGKVAGLEAESAALAAQIGTADTAALAGDLAQARSDELAMRADAADATAAAQHAATLRTALTDARERADTLRVHQAGADAELAERDVALAALRAERVRLLADEAADLEALISRRSRVVEALDAAVEDLDTVNDARRATDAAVTALAEAAVAAGFASPEGAARALLPPVEAFRIETALADAEARRLAAEATLAEPEVRDAAEQPLPDPAAATAAHEHASLQLQAAAATVETARTRLARVGQLDDELAAALNAWEPLRASHRLAADLASLVEGRSVDNPLRMRLAAYVLAERLRQVVAAANERLQRMTGARFALEHVLDRGVGEQRGGLSLRIRDDWNGVDRDPATLSGGETFVVSLALALGLADTVAHEAGGTDVDTLFIDEGFGSLDADTLEDVMDTLDTLRDGGRVVGLVSHVPELRSRVTTQLEVLKSRTGSTLRPVVAAG